MKSDRIKLAVAIVIFVAAAALIAWNTGLFGGSGTGAPSPSSQSSTGPAAQRGGPQMAPEAK